MKVGPYLPSQCQDILGLTRNALSRNALPRLLAPSVPGLNSFFFQSGSIPISVQTLTDDRLFGQEVRIQDVKSSPQSGLETIGRFLKAVDGYESTVTRLGTLGGRVRHPHPWFGPMTAHDWHCLAAIHYWLHRRQRERIVGKLRDEARPETLPLPLYSL